MGHVIKTESGIIGGIVNWTVIPFANSGNGLMFDEKEKFNLELLRVLQS